MLSRELYFIPSKVNLDDIREEKGGILFLLEEGDRNTLIDLLSNPAIPDGHYSKNKQLKNMLAKAGKQLNFNEYDVIKLNGEIYLVYKGVQQEKHIGAGGEGVVKATQNLRTGSWDGALKIFSERHTPEKGETPIVTSGKQLDDREENVKKEYESLRAEGAGIGLLPRRKDVSRKGVQDAIMMRFARGEDLFDLRNRYENPNNAKLPISEWLDIMIQMCEIVQKLHDQNKIHRDLKIENFRYDSASKKVTLVDFSGIKTLNDHGEVYDALKFGTPGYLASEVLSSNIYTAKSDNFALGVTIADMFAMLDEESFNASGQKVPYKLRSEEQIVNTPHSLVTEEQKSFLIVLHEICSELMADTYTRPDNLTKIIGDLKDLKTQITETLTVGIFNVADFRKAGILDKYEMLDYFKRFNEVVLIDTDLNGSIKDHVILQRELAKYNVIVRDKVFIGEINQVTEEVKKQFANESEFVTKTLHVLADMTIFDKAKTAADWDPEAMSPDEKKVFLEKAFRVLMEFSSTDTKHVTATEFAAMELVIKTYEENLSISHQNEKSAELIKAVREKMDKLEVKESATNSYPTEHTETQSATDRFITLLSEIDSYKADKQGGRVHNTRADLERNLQKLDGILEQLLHVREAFTANPDVANKKYLELCDRDINFISREIVSLTPQLDDIDLNDKVKIKEDRTENLLAELDSIADSLQSERVMQKNAENLLQLRSAVNEVRSNISGLDSDINAILQAYNEALHKLEQIPVNKRLPDDVMLLADFAKNAAALAEQHGQQADAALETAVLLLDRAKYYLPLKTYKSSPNLLFSCIEKIANAYEEVCTYYLKRGARERVQAWSTQALEFLSDVLINLPSETQERIESLKNQFEIMYALDIDALEVVTEGKSIEADPAPSQPNAATIENQPSSRFEKITAMISKPNLSEKHFEAAARQLNLIPANERTIEFYSTLLKVTNAYSKYSLDQGDVKSAKKNLELAVNNIQSILPSTDMLAISSLYMRSEANQTTEFLTKLAVSFKNLAMIAMQKNDFNTAINYFDQASQLLTNLSEDTLSEEQKVKIKKSLTSIKHKVRECIDAKADNAIFVGRQMAAVATSEPVAEAIIQSQTTIISANGVMQTEVVQVEEPRLQRQMESPEALQHIKDPDHANFNKPHGTELQPLSPIPAEPHQEPVPGPSIANQVEQPAPVKEVMDEKLLEKLKDLLPLFERMADQYSKYETHSGLKGFRSRTYADMRDRISEILDLAQQNRAEQVSSKLKELNESVDTLFKRERESVRKHIHFNAAKLFFTKFTKSTSTLEKCLTELKTALESAEPYFSPRNKK